MRTRRTCISSLPVMIIAVAFLVLFSGCSRKPGEIQVEPSTFELTGKGSVVGLVAKARDSGGKVMEGLTFKWVSSNPDVATVSEEGTVTAVSSGTVDITASMGELAATSRGSVLVIREVRVDPSELQIQVGDDAGLTVTGITDLGEERSLDADRDKITWSSSDEGVVKIVTPMKVKGAGSGIVTVTASYAGVSGSARVKVLPVIRMENRGGRRAVESGPIPLDLWFHGSDRSTDFQARDGTFFFARVPTEACGTVEKMAAEADLHSIDSTSSFIRDLAFQNLAYEMKVSYPLSGRETVRILFVKVRKGDSAANFVVTRKTHSLLMECLGDGDAVTRVADHGDVKWFLTKCNEIIAGAGSRDQLNEGDVVQMIAVAFANDGNLRRLETALNRMNSGDLRKAMNELRQGKRAADPWSALTYVIFEAK
jgi:hypothetical protein